jgi:hypothetical protein
MKSYIVTKWLKLNGISVLTHVLKEDDSFCDPLDERKDKVFKNEKEAEQYITYQCKQTRLRFLTGKETIINYRIMSKRSDIYE